LQTCIIRKNELAFAEGTAAEAGIENAAGVRLTVEGDRLIVEPGGEDRRVHLLHLRVPPPVLSSLGWQSGDVVGIEAGPRRLEIEKVIRPMDPGYTTVGEDGIPVPPHWLVQMVIGKPAIDVFVEGGHKVAKLFAGLIERHLPGPEAPAVIDFGCGCGRVSRALSRYLDCRISGCDITAAAVEWCGENLPGDYFMSTEEPPIGVPDAAFDVLYSVSVLTHLDERRQDAWLAEWRRIVRPGGLLLVTYRGEGFLSRSGPPRREQIERLWESDGMGFMTTDHWEGLFPSYYGGAYHTHAYVEEHWGRYFEVLEIHAAPDTGLVLDLAVMRYPG
jgi:SAM-dependent methyltransferase